MANKKISQLTNSLTKATVDSADLLPVVDTSASETKKMTYQELIQPTDANFRIAGSADNTKLVAFEVDGLTTATTRTVTIPDATTTMVGTDTTQTLSNKTLTAPQVNMGSDATGDMYYRNGSAVTTRLPIGTSGQILQTSAGGVPEWIANPSVSDASTTTKGVGELATYAEINAGTATGGTGAPLLVTPDQLLLSNYLTTSSTAQKLGATFLAGESITAGNAVSGYFYQSDGGVTFDNDATNNGSVSSAGGVVSFSFTVGANSNRMLLVYVNVGAASGTVPTPTVTYGGTPMSAVRTETYQTYAKLFSFSLAAPATGSNTLAITLSASAQTNYVSTGVVSFYNVSAIENSAGDVDASVAYGTPGLGVLLSSAAARQAAGSSANNYNNLQDGGANSYARIATADSGHAFTTSSATVTYSGGEGITVIGLTPVTTPTYGYVVKSSAASATNGVNLNKYTLFTGFAQSTATVGQSVTVTTDAGVTGLTGLTPLSTYYLSDTPGAIAVTAGTNSKKVGFATTSTTLLMKDTI